MSIVRFPRFNLHNVPEALRKLADDIERGDEPVVHAVVAVQDAEGNPGYYAFGAEFSRMHAVGILHGAQHLILNCE